MLDPDREGSNYVRTVHVFLNNDCIFEIVFQGKLFEVNNKKQTKHLSFTIDESDLDSKKNQLYTKKVQRRKQKKKRRKKK